MSDTLQQLKDDRDSLKRAIRSGVQSVTVDGQTTTFASVNDMRKALSDVEREIAACVGTVESKPRVSSINLGRGV